MITEDLGIYDAALLEDAVDSAEVGLQLLNKDLLEASKIMPLDEVRHLVDAYYTIQRNRIGSAAQERELEASGQPHLVITWLRAQHHILETQLKRVLDRWTDQQILTRWCKSICGIGPVISAGLISHIDITKAPTAGHIWSFAGANPEAVWEKGQKRPWNGDLKTLVMYKMGESFVKVQNNSHDVYGKLFAERRRKEDAMNEQGMFRSHADLAMQKKKFGKDTLALAAYKEGKLPKAHLHARARRFAVKIFLSHYHLVAYFLHYGVMPVKPFVFVHGQHADGHAHLYSVPNMEMIPGLTEAYAEYVKEIRKRKF